ncbi:MAG: hypothetical protein KY468_02270 [Armatimonadetes bacterium]|nr:hypothetical protein [Armatimonadota bacterium]
MRTLHSSAFGIAWMIGRQHRRGIAIMLAYLTLLAIYVGSGTLSPLDETAFVLAVLLPIFGSLIYVLTLFLPLEADVASPDSGYPSHMRVLPIRTMELALWPMFYGTLSISLLWVGIAALILEPLGMSHKLIIWPGAMLAALLACLQALSWFPLGVPYLRVILALLVLPVVLIAGINGYASGLPAATLTWSFLLAIPFAFGIAYAGIARARRGETFPWAGFTPSASAKKETLRRSLPSAFPAFHPPRPFASPAQAQLWMEWRRNGWNLPLAVGMTCLLLSLPFFLDLGVGDRGLEPAPSWLPDDFSSLRVSFMYRIPLVALILPVVYAWIVGCGLRKSDTRRKDLTLNPFLTVRPISTAALVGIKLRMAAWSALTAWSILLLFEAGWLFALPARSEAGEGSLLDLLVSHATLRNAATAGALLLFLLFLTWRNQVENLGVDFTGRPWIVNGYPLVMALLISLALYFTPMYLVQPSLFSDFLRSLPRWAALALAIKLGLAGWAAAALWRRGLLEGKTLAFSMGAWLLAAVTLIGGGLRLLPEGGVSFHSLMLGALLFLPLARLSLAPLALAWNRHR